MSSSASDDSCDAATRPISAAGKTTFRITNDGSKVTEVYVYAAGDRVVTERENIGPGTSADLTVSLAAGAYELACKPGQKGDGIRQAITVTGEGGEALPEDGDIEVHFTAVDYAFEGLDALDAHAGETVKFEMRNSGDVEHEFEVFGPDGEVLGEVGPTAPGEEGEADPRARGARHLPLRVRHRRPPRPGDERRDDRRVATGGSGSRRIELWLASRLRSSAGRRTDWICRFGAQASTLRMHSQALVIRRARRLEVLDDGVRSLREA